MNKSMWPFIIIDWPRFFSRYRTDLRLKSPMLRGHKFIGDISTPIGNSVHRTVIDWNRTVEICCEADRAESSCIFCNLIIMPPAWRITSILTWRMLMLWYITSRVTARFDEAGWRRSIRRTRSNSSFSSPSLHLWGTISFRMARGSLFCACFCRKSWSI